MTKRGSTSHLKKLNLSKMSHAGGNHTPSKYDRMSSRLSEFPISGSTSPSNLKKKLTSKNVKMAINLQNINHKDGNTTITEDQKRASNGFIFNSSKIDKV